jgi:hypothetical protein
MAFETSRDGYKAKETTQIRLREFARLYLTSGQRAKDSSAQVVLERFLRENARSQDLEVARGRMHLKSSANRALLAESCDAAAHEYQPNYLLRSLVSQRHRELRPR